MKDMILLVDMAYIAINPEVVVIPSSPFIILFYLFFLTVIWLAVEQWAGTNQNAWKWQNGFPTQLTHS